MHQQRLAFAVQPVNLHAQVAEIRQPTMIPRRHVAFVSKRGMLKHDALHVLFGSEIQDIDMLDYVREKSQEDHFAFIIVFDLDLRRREFAFDEIMVVNRTSQFQLRDRVPFLFVRAQPIDIQFLAGLKFRLINHSHMSIEVT